MVHMQKAGSDVNCWAVVHDDFHNTLLGGHEEIMVELNGNNPPTVKQYSRFSVYATENNYTIPNGTDTENLTYPQNTTPTYLNAEAIYEPDQDVVFTFGGAKRGQTFPAISDGTWYLYCIGGYDNSSSTKGYGVYNTSKTDTPTYTHQKGGWYSANGYRVLASFVVASSVVSTLIIYQAAGSMIYKNTEKTTPIIGDLVRISDSAGSYNERYSTIGNMLKVANYATKTTDYTILDTDYSGERFIGNPNSSSAQWGLLTFTLPTIADNIGKWYEVEHGANQGLIKIASESSDGLYFKQQTKSLVLLYSPGSVYKFYNNGSKWVVTGSNVMEVGYQNHSDWTSINLGNGVTYDTKSSAVDLTGRVITESTSSFSAVIVEDTGNTSSTGILYVYELSSGFTFWTNNRTLTASGGTTCLVNEVSGTSRNTSYNTFHEFDFNAKGIVKELYCSTDRTENNSFQLGVGDSGSGTSVLGFTFHQNNTNSIVIACSSTGATTTTKAFAALNLGGSDYYYNIILTFSA